MKKLGLGSRIALSFIAAAVGLGIGMSSGESNNYDIVDITPENNATIQGNTVTVSRSGIFLNNYAVSEYRYALSGTNNNHVVTGTTTQHKPTFNINLITGNYDLRIGMFSSDSTPIILATGHTNFTVTSPTGSIEIISPSSGARISGNTTNFSRNGSITPASALSGYRYVLLRTGSTPLSGFTNNSSIELNTPIPGNYIFGVSLIDTNDVSIATGLTNFTVVESPSTTTGSVQITSGKNQTITSGSTTSFTWTGSITPDSEFSGFRYTLSGTNNGYIVTGNASKTTTGCTSPLPLPSGNYVFTVSVISTSDQAIANDTTNLTVTNNTPGSSESEPSTTTGSVQITSGTNQTITSGNTASFTWTGSITPDSEFSGFRYTLSGTDNNYIKTEDASKTTTGYTSVALSSGNYVFTVSVISTSDQAIANDTTNLTVTNNTPSNPDELNMTIYSPGKSTTIRTNDVPFSFEGTYPSGHTFKDYKYYIRKNSSNGSSISGGTLYTGGLTGFTYHLPDGKYYFEATMHTLDSEGFAADKTEGRGFLVFDDISLTITSPVTNYSVCIAETGTDFTRTGYAKNTFSGFEYTVVSDDGQYQYSGSTTSPTNTSFPLNDLTEGGYTFSVTLNYASGHSTGKDVHFCIELPDPESSLSISSPVQNKTYTGTSLKFAWSGSYDGGYFSYRYNLSGPTSTGNNTTSKSFTGNGLRDGTYNFSVEMIDSNGDTLRSQSRTFYIELPYTLKINSPTSGYNSPSSNVTLSWTGTHPYKSGFCYTVSGLNNSTYNTKCTTGTTTGLTLGDGKYSFTLDMMATYNNTNPLYSTGIIFNVNSNKSLNVSSSPSGTITGTNVTGVDVTVYWTGDNENFSSYRYTLKRNGSIYSSGTSTNKTGSKKYEYLPSGTYDFHIDMLNNTSGTITSGDTNFKIVIPTTLTFNTPVISQNNVTLGWTGFTEDFHHYQYSVDTISGTKNITSGTWNQYYTGFTLKELQSDNYKLTVYIKNNSGDTISGNSISFTIDYTPPTPVQPSGGGGGGGGGGGYSSKSHPTNDLKLSIGNSSPSANEWIKLIVNIKDNYVGKVSFPKLQYYSGNAEKWIDIPVTSKNFVSDYSDDAKLGYIRFSSSDDGEKELSQFIKFSKNGYYRIYAEDKDGFDTYVQFRVGNTTNTNTGKTDVDSILREYIPEIFEEDTEEEIYIARSCKKYTIIYSDTLNIYTSPNLNISEFFTSKAYLKRYLDSKNRWQPGCPTNVGWITTNYIDRSNSNTRYTAPNGKVYLITGEEGNYYSNELNRELKTPSSFKTIQELKYYIRDRNPLINMATLGPVN